MCNCEVHIKVDEELEKEGHTRLKCVGHPEQDPQRPCPCIIQNDRT